MTLGDVRCRVGDGVHVLALALVHGVAKRHLRAVVKGDVETDGPKSCTVHRGNVDGSVGMIGIRSHGKNVVPQFSLKETTFELILAWASLHYCAQTQTLTKGRKKQYNYI